MILTLLRVIKEANDLIEKAKKERSDITDVYQDLSAIDDMIERIKESDNTSLTTK